jgi:hypothetical protein
MKRSMAIGTATAAVTAALLWAPVAPASAVTATVDVPIGAGVAAINAACAASQPLAETGVRVTASGTTVAAYNRTAAVVQQAWDGPGEGLVLTTSPPGLYREMPRDEAAFAKRALKKLGSTATWTLDPTPSVTLTDVIPSPGDLIRTTLKAPGASLAPVTQCASNLLANPERGTVFAQRTDDAGGTSWRVVAGADYLGLENDYDNGVLAIIRVNPQGIIDRVERGWISSDGLSAIGQDLRWEYGVQPAVTVPPTASTVDWDRFVAARGSFISSDLQTFARATARRPLPAATQKALQTRVRNALAVARLDPMFPPGSRATRNGVIVWQTDTATGTVHAIRFSRPGNGTQVGFTKVADFRP